MDFILNKKVKYYTKEVLKYFNIIIVAFGLIIAIILIKYKPMYKISISGQELGFVENKEVLKESIKEEAIRNTDKNVEDVSLKVNPEYELKLIDRTLKTNEQEIIETVQDNVQITYKYYDITLNNETIDTVDTIDEAKELIEEIKLNKDELDLSIIEKYTENIEEVKTTDLELAKTEIENKINDKLEETKKKQEEQERINSMPEINGIKLAYVPVSGTISSRYGVSSRIRKSTHTGLDIATSAGTPIKAVASGKITCASYNGAYGNLVKINHGNGLETWYAHTSKMYVNVGQEIKAGDIIAAVGSTGNSTGAHLHLEIRIDGEHINPQEYLYK